jgi:coproporphyrinogen III oxidase-like Fe-S oxidoreductase
VNHGRLKLHVEARAEVIDHGQADDFVAAGIHSVEVGLQSTDPDSLRTMHRSLGRDRFVAGCEYLRDRGIRAEIGVILGLPGDNERSIRRTLDFACGRRLGHVSVYRLQVLPGSEYARRADSLGLVYDRVAPYFVRSTASMTEALIDRLEQELYDQVASYNTEYLRRLDATLQRPRFTSGRAETAKKSYTLALPTLQ